MRKEKYKVVKRYCDGNLSIEYIDDFNEALSTYHTFCADFDRQAGPGNQIHNVELWLNIENHLFASYGKK